MWIRIRQWLCGTILTHAWTDLEVAKLLADIPPTPGKIVLLPPSLRPEVFSEALTIRVPRIITYCRRCGLDQRSVEDL